MTILFLNSSKAAVIVSDEVAISLRHDVKSMCEVLLRQKPMTNLPTTYSDQSVDNKEVEITGV